LGFYPSYFGYFYGSGLGLVLQGAWASFLDTHVLAVLLGMEGLEDVRWASAHLVLERSGIMAGLNIYFARPNLELGVACPVIEEVVALQASSWQDLDWEALK
jgi:hypothetical protein